MKIKIKIKKNSIAGFAAALLLSSLAACGLSSRNAPAGEETLASLAEQFQSPPVQYHPHVWWHWMGSNFSKEGITRDLEAMKEAGIGGATIFNLTSAVQNTQAPIENNPWPEQTFRSEAYWDALRHTMAEARRLGLTIGLHGTPGYATTGGPWISEERCMQTLVFSTVSLAGNRPAEVVLAKPELPAYRGFTNEKSGTNYGRVPTSRRATYYKDVAVLAIPEKLDPKPDEALDISGCMDADGRLKWTPPAGRWRVCRIGHAPTMANPHPLPDDIIGKALEVDKMSREDNVYHWRQLLDPLKEHIGEYFGSTFAYIWVDSYESGDQDWTPSFRDEFRRMKGYDPLPQMMLQRLSEKLKTGESGAAAGESAKRFREDFREVRSRLYIDNGWKVARDMLHDYGLKFYWEPYEGPYNRIESIAIPDLPIDEFWTHTEVFHKDLIPRVAGKAGRRIVGVEAFVGRPVSSRYTEDPAFLKHSADAGFLAGMNLFFLNHWTHQPFDDRYQPGMGFGWWGTHFGRHQTWFKPGKAFFTYLARCQMLLQQGDFVSSDLRETMHRTTRDAEIFFAVNRSSAPVAKTYSFPVGDRAPELWDAYSGTIRKTNRRADGDSIRVDLRLEADESLFVVFPKNSRCAYEKLRLPAMETGGEKVLSVISGTWKVRFQPKLDAEFTREFPALVDFSKHEDTAVKYFAGTASYEKTIDIAADLLDKNKRITLDLGELHDIAELEVNGKSAGVLWCPPYKADISQYLKKGENKITVHVTVNWANRLIGDEQHPADFEWGRDRDEEGRAMKAFPDWFIRNEPRPSQGRKAFAIWYYFRKDSPLYPAGLIGPLIINY
ncbi:MAG: hypothetical protein LBD35_02835 [Prevotellaceae bacterium]|nr:hypothetical protein [Prevotellaceae bacterium]